MTEQEPAAIEKSSSVYLVYGDDRSAMQDFVASLLAKVSPDPGMRELNTTRLEGKQAGEDAIHAAAYALPFLTSRRLVIVTEAMERFKSPESLKRLIALLEGLPPSTELVLEVEDEFIPSGKDRGWQIMGKAGKKLLEWVEKNPSRARSKLCQLPQQSSMPGWIISDTRRLEGQITPQAAAALAALVGTDTGLARQEIIKLLTYVDYKRSISLEDVQELAAPGGQADVFAMVDAMALGNGPLALRHLGRLLEEQDQYSLFGMIVRQFRLLILTKEAALEGVRDQATLAQRLRSHPKVAGKMMAQAQHYSITDLEGIYHRLFEVDKMIKTGQIDPDIALQTFVAGLSV